MNQTQNVNTAPPKTSQGGSGMSSVISHLQSAHNKEYKKLEEKKALEESEILTKALAPPWMSLDVSICLKLHIYRPVAAASDASKY